MPFNQSHTLRWEGGIAVAMSGFVNTWSLREGERGGTLLPRRGLRFEGYYVPSWPEAPIHEIRGPTRADGAKNRPSRNDRRPAKRT
jgi:hypothetical protein